MVSKALSPLTHYGKVFRLLRSAARVERQLKEAENAVERPCGISWLMFAKNCVFDLAGVLGHLEGIRLGDDFILELVTLLFELEVNPDPAQELGAVEGLSQVVRAPSSSPLTTASREALALKMITGILFEQALLLHDLEDVIA